MASRELNSLADRFFHGGADYTPNRAAACVVEIVDSDAALSEFMVQLQEAGGDVACFSEEDWRDLLEKKFQVHPDEMGDYLEQLAAWGVVDNNWYLDEGL